ncbi:hypothetical protein RSOLAG1IB_05625 [Rhizoctonia solani AG-1 IB]|uniref:Uncharacterized protein n=1 Tax=Thanatephorus cucumeris (strain AG1-IB / isolate 7/3/14) TaxID=1108050 RepID=A0A0B7G0U7_THACB|nr:hypothetical protein RSOLAG1IB_05625 [Rhizoctonia solani AG-1 IB]
MASDGYNRHPECERLSIMSPLSNLWSSLLGIFFPFYKIYQSSSGPVPTLSVVRPRRIVRLPPEILDDIFLFHIVHLFGGLQCGTVREYRIRQKQFMHDVCRVARCSKQFSQIIEGSLRRVWASCLGNPSSETTGSQPAQGVWIITADAKSLPIDFNLAVYKRLEIASLNYHGGVEWSQTQQCFRRFRCITSYPRSLRQLEILRSHTPEEEVVRLVSDCCPGLTELRLVRCTMFNDPKCWYWRAHTSHHDHDYMKSYEIPDVIDYANRMAHLLRGLPQLEALHIGHYLITVDAVSTHRFDAVHKSYHPITDRASHVDGARIFNPLQFAARMNLEDDGPPINCNTIRLADRDLWSTSCRECERQFASPIEVAERLASGILAAHIGTLKHASFANFLSERRIRPSSWLVERLQYNGDLCYVWTEDPGRPRPRISQELVRVNDRWEPPTNMNLPN